MPTYEYACRQCGLHVDVVQTISDEPLTTCGACGGELRKVFHPAGVLFKGSGFYATDNRKGSKPAESKPESKPESKQESKQAESTESKPSTTPKEKSA